MPMEAADFYRTTPVVPDIAAAAEGGSLAPLPEDWWMLVTDIVGSTRHIEAGEYKNINLIGAASITAVLNSLGRPDLPYYFGGDGAQIACPPEWVDTSLAALRALAHRAKQAFGFQLRAAAYRVGDLRRDGFDLRLGRLEVAPGVPLAVFGGSGLIELDRRLKEQTPIGVAEGDPGDPDLTGLECKWKEVPAPKEEIASLLVIAAPGHPRPTEVYRATLEKLRALLGAPEDRHPLRAENMRLEFSLAGQTRELTLHYPRLPRILRPLVRVFLALEIYLGDLLRRHPAKLLGVDWARYFRDVIRHGDSEKFNGMLSMVVSCTSGQRRKLEAWLEDGYREGRLAYGLHTSRAALLTCMVFDRDRRHVHFVDGSDGGYASAARELKKRLASLPR